MEDSFSFSVHHSSFGNYAAFATLPALMQVVQTFIRTVPPCGRWTRIDCRLGLNRRGVRLFACETLLPNCGPLPQTSHRLAMIALPPNFEKRAIAVVRYHRHECDALRKRNL